MNFKISVIVPIYNVEKYLCKCIDSIINQTYDNLEIILVDDGTKDSCGIICDEYSLKDPRIKVIHKKNGGLSDARNAGLDIATGDYISFIDSDDYLNKEFYETLADLISRYDADVAQCEFLKVFEEDGNHSDDKSGCNENISVFTNYEALENLFNENYDNTVVVWNKLYKRELFKSIRYPKGKVHEDEYTTYKVLFNAGKVVSTTRKMYYYLQRSNSITGDGFNIRRLDAIDAFNEQIVFYSERNLTDLSAKARIKFAGFLRGLMSGALNSRLENREEIFNELLDYYRKNYGLFSDDANIGFNKKINMSLFKYSPVFIVKLICRFMYMKSRLTA